MPLRPKRIPAQLLVIPYREEVEASVRAYCGPSVAFNLELERNATVRFGEVSEVVAFVPDHNGHKGFVARHVMPLAAVDDRRSLIAAARLNLPAPSSMLSEPVSSGERHGVCQNFRLRVNRTA